MRKKKKKWIIPQLLVLVKGKPDEMVLSACKSGSGSSGPAGSNAECYIVSCGTECASLLAS